VCLHRGLAIYIAKVSEGKRRIMGAQIFLQSIFLRQKKELWKLKYFTMQKYINLGKKSSKRN
jgi:hypothetical protein